MNEELQKAVDDLAFAWGDLREALGKATNVECILILDLIGRAAELRNAAEALLNAHASDTSHERQHR